MENEQEESTHGTIGIAALPEDRNISLGEMLDYLGERIKPPSNAKIAAALAKAQGAFDDIPKNKIVKVTNKEGKFLYEFKYADIAGIISATTEALSENGIAVVQTPKIEPGNLTMVTRLLHESGEELTGEMSVPIAEGGKLQDLGSVITYLRRYMLTAMLNVSADDDTDGNTENAEVSDSEPTGKAVKGKMEKLGAEVRDILIALDNVDFHDSLSDDWRISFSHLLTNKEGHILDSDKWRDIVEVEDHVNLIEMKNRKNISKGAKFIGKEFKKWEAKNNG